MSVDRPTHINPEGDATMVDVSSKTPTRREALAEVRVVFPRHVPVRFLDFGLRSASSHAQDFVEVFFHIECWVPFSVCDKKPEDPAFYERQGSTDNRPPCALLHWIVTLSRAFSTQNCL